MGISVGQGGWRLSRAARWFLGILGVGMIAAIRSLRAHPGLPGRTILTLSLPVFLSLSLGCAPPEVVNSGPVVRDSAGIAIVENAITAPRWTTPWVLSEEPTLRIGSTEGDTTQMLYQVTDTHLMEDGRVLVVNSGSADVRIYSSEGRLLQTLGRRGDGPGEFRAPWHAYPIAGDSILVVDLYREVAVFDPSGALAREIHPRLPPGLSGGEGASPVDQFGDGSLLFKGHISEDPEWEGLRRNSVLMLRIPLNGDSAGTLGEFDDQTIRYGRPFRQYALGAEGTEAAGASTMWYGPGDRLELREVALDGTLLKLVRLDQQARPVTEADREGYKSAYVEQMATWNPGRGDDVWRRQAEDMQFPDSFPVHYAMETDPLGNLWVQDYRSWISETGMDRAWTVFDGAGTYLGEVVVPSGLNVHDISETHIVGTWTDDLGVEYVHVYRIEKPVG